MNIDIQAADISDVMTIAAFNSRMAPETDEKVLDSARIASGVANLIDDPAKGQHWVADSHRRQGAFSMLHKHVKSLAMHDPGVCGIRLYVERGIDRAQQTYRSLSMNGAGYLVMESIFPVGEDSTNA